MFKKHTRLLFGSLLVSVLMFLSLSPTVLAADPPATPTTTTTPTETCQSITSNQVGSGGTKLTCISETSSGENVQKTVDCPSGTTGDCSFTKRFINPALVFFTAAFGLTVVISIIFAGIQYASSDGDPQRVSAAKQRIRNAIVAIVAYILLLGLLNWLIPGGL